MNYKEIPKLPRTLLYPNDEFKGRLSNFKPKKWTKFGTVNKYTTDFSTFIYRRPIKDKPIVVKQKSGSEKIQLRK